MKVALTAAGVVDFNITTLKKTAEKDALLALVVPADQLPTEEDRGWSAQKCFNTLFGGAAQGDAQLLQVVNTIRCNTNSRGG